MQAAMHTVDLASELVKTPLPIHVQSRHLRLETRLDINDELSCFVHAYSTDQCRVMVFGCGNQPKVFPVQHLVEIVRDSNVPLELLRRAACIAAESNFRLKHCAAMAIGSRSWQWAAVGGGICARLRHGWWRSQLDVFPWHGSLEHPATGNERASAGDEAALVLGAVPTESDCGEILRMPMERRAAVIASRDPDAMIAGLRYDERAWTRRYHHV